MLLLEITEAITQLSQKELEKVKYAVRKEQKKRKAQAANVNSYSYLCYMKKVAIIFLALSIVSCKKEQIQQTYNGDLINIQIESNSSTLYVNNIEYVSNINKLDTNIRLFANDTIRIINKSYANDTQHIKCTINYNKYYSAIYYNNHIYDSVKACPSYSRIIYNDNSLIFTIAYRYKS